MFRGTKPYWNIRCHRKRQTYFSLIHFREKFFLSVLIKTNKGTWTVTLCVHFPKFCELKAWTCSYCGSHKNFLIMFIFYFREEFRLLKIGITNCAPLAVGRVAQSKIRIPNFASIWICNENFKTKNVHFLYLSSYHRPKISVVKTECTIIQQNASFQRQC